MFPLQGIICNVRATCAFRSYLHRKQKYVQLKVKKNKKTATQLIILRIFVLENQPYDNKNLNVFIINNLIFYFHIFYNVCL